MKFADAGDFIEILIYLGALILGLVLNMYRNKNKRQARGDGETHQDRPVFPDVFFEPVLDDIRPEYDEREIYEPETVPVAEETHRPAEVSFEKSVPSDRYKSYNPEEGQIDTIGQEGESAFALDFVHQVSDDINESFIDSIVATEVSESESDITSGTIDVEREPFDFDVRKAIIFAEIIHPKHQY